MLWYDRKNTDWLAELQGLALYSSDCETNVLRVVLCFRILSFIFPHKIILELMFRVLGTTLWPSARCTEQICPRIAFVLAIWKHGALVEILPQVPWEGRWSRRWIWDLESPSSPMMLKPVLLSPSDVTSVWTLWSIWHWDIPSQLAWETVCVSVCLHTEGDEKCFKRKSLCVTELLSPHARRVNRLFISQRIWVCYKEAPASLFCCLEGQLWLSGVRCYAAVFQQRALLILGCISFISVLSERLLI